MRRWLYAALILYFSENFATAGERYGAWLLEYPRSSVVTLSIALNNSEVARSELVFICDKADDSKLVAILVPLAGRFESACTPGTDDRDALLHHA